MTLYFFLIDLSMTQVSWNLYMLLKFESQWLCKKPLLAFYDIVYIFIPDIPFLLRLKKENFQGYPCSRCKFHLLLSIFALKWSKIYNKHIWISEQWQIEFSVQLISHGTFLLGMGRAQKIQTRLLAYAHPTWNRVLACFIMHSLQSCRQKWLLARKKYLD